jgi:branched-chain amino acid transport system substrate-binding protein
MEIKEEPLNALLSRLTVERALSRRTFLGLLAGATGTVAIPSLLAACGTSSSGAAKFNLGIIIPETGPLVASFAPTFVSLHLAVKEINAAGGIMGRQINLISFDDQGAPAQEPQIAQNIQGQDLNFIAGPVGSSQCLASVAVLQRGQVIQSPLGADPTLGDPTKYPGNFMLKESTDQDADVMVNDFFTTGAQKVAIMYENTAYGQSLQPRAVQLLAAKNVTPVLQDSFDPLAASMRADIAKVKATGADCVFIVVANSGAAIKLITEFIQQDYTPFIETSSSFFINFAGSLPAGVKLTNEFAGKIRAAVYQNFVWSPGKPVSTRVSDFCKKIVADPGVPVPARYSAINAPFYDYLYILKQSIEAAKSFDYAKVKTEMEHVTNFDGIIGKLSFTPTDHHGVQDSQMTGGSPSDFSAPESLGFLPQRVA